MPDDVVYQVGTGTIQQNCNTTNIRELEIGFALLILSLFSPMLAVLRIIGIALIGSGLLSLFGKWNGCLCNCPTPTYGVQTIA
jgi:membrane-bound ClpP family serine protease